MKNAGPQVFPKLTNVVFNEEASKDLGLYVKNLQKFLADLLSKRTSLCYTDRIIPLSLVDARRALIAHHTANHSSCNNVIKNALLKLCIDSEKHASMAAGIALLTIASIGRHSDRITIPDLEDTLKLAAHVNKSTAYSIIRQTLKDDYAYEMIVEAHELAGAAGQIFANDSKYKRSSVELRHGYRFPVGYIPEFTHVTKGEAWKDHDVRVLIIDGIIESVGEIHHILEYFSSNKDSLVLFARGFKEEVVATLILNNMRKALNVVPVHAPVDIEGINMFVDLAYVCGCDVVSSLKGELISSIDPESATKVGFIDVRQKNISIENSATTTAVKSHVNNLLKRRKKSSSLDLSELLDKRLSNLSATNVQIYLGPEHAAYIGTLTDRLEVGIRLLNDIAAFGAIKIDDMLKSDNKIIKKICNQLQSMNIDFISSRALHVGIMNGIIFSQLFNDTSVFIVKDEG